MLSDIMIVRNILHKLLKYAISSSVIRTYQLCNYARLDISILIAHRI